MRILHIPEEIQSQLRTFSTIEKQAVYAVMGNVAAVDNNIAPSEVEAMNYISDVAGITYSDKVAANKMSVEAIYSTVNSMPESKRKLVARLISTIVTADGKVDLREQALAMILVEKLNLKMDWFH